MSLTMPRIAGAVIAIAILCGSVSGAHANKWDLSLARFIKCEKPAACEPKIAAYERFMAEYTFGLSPKILSPAETLGYSGFYLGFESTITPVPVDARGTGDYDPDDDMDNRWINGTAQKWEYPGVMFVPGIHIRKGLPWSFEIGSSVNFLAGASLVALGGEVKWTLFEGYRHGFRGALPDLAARGSVVRIVGETDADITIIGVDGSISYTFGAGGMVSLTPYAGYQYLWSIIRVEPLIYRDDIGHSDWKTENDRNGSSEDEFHARDGELWNTTGLSGPNLGRSKLFLGFRIQYEVLALTFEAGWGLAQKWNTAVIPDYKGGSDAFDEDQATTEVGHQLQASFGIGLDF